MRKGYRPPGAIFFLHRRRKNMERKTPRRAGGTPPYEPTPLGGCRWRGWLGTSYQADLSVHPYPVSRCADRLPLRCCLRVCGCGLGDGVVGGFCVERSHAARRHAQRCGAPKAPLKGELAARNALSEGFCGRASGARSAYKLAAAQDLSVSFADSSPFRGAFGFCSAASDYEQRSFG